MNRQAGPRRRQRPPLGQHFLSDPDIRHQILRWLDCRASDCWLEIGAGHGEMTLALAAASRRVVAVERDARLAAALRERLGSMPGAQVIAGDILQVSLAALGRAAGVVRWRLYGNLPYYITSPILHRLFEASESLADIHLVIQREVAERLVAAPGGRDYGYLSVLTQLHTTPEVLLVIPRRAFRPPPRVDSALVRLVPPGKKAALNLNDAEAFLRFVQTCFRQKRKTLRNNLRALAEPARVEKALAAAELAPRARAEELSLEQFVRLFRLLADESAVG